MMKCKDCGSSQFEGTLFCSECGCFLIKEATGTNILPFSDFVRPIPPSPIDQFRPRILNEPLALTIVIPSSRRRLKLELTDQIRIGRSDGRSASAPEFDLAGDNGAEMGISRKHAAIQVAGNGLAIIDLGSTNGTYLNNALLSPKLPYPLKNGDEIRFGELLIHVLFSRKKSDMAA